MNLWGQATQQRVQKRLLSYRIAGWTNQAEDGQNPMKLILFLGTLLIFNGCATGMFGPEAQRRAQQSLEYSREQFAKAKADFAQAGADFAQVGRGLGQAAATYAQGYSQPYQQYQPAQPAYQLQPQMHSGTIISPDGVSTYWDHGNNGMIIGPDGVSTYWRNGNNTTILGPEGPTFIYGH